MSGPVSRRAFLYGLYLLTLVTVALSVTEFAVLPRLGPAVPRDIQLMGFYAPPNTMIDDTRISSMGFAGDAVALAKPAGTRRILMLGSSSFFNRRMAERLKEKMSGMSEGPIEVVGAALRSHTSMSSVLKYKVLAKYNFDDVLIYEAINDLWANLVPLEQFDDDYAHLGCAYRRGFLLDNSLVARGLYDRFFCHVAPPQFSRSTLENGAGFSSERTFGRNLRTLVESARRHGARPVLLTFAWSAPETYTKERFLAGEAGYRNPEKYDAYPLEFWGKPPYVREGLQRHNRIVRAVASELRVPLIDAESYMENNPAWFGDPCHLNEEGTDRFIGYVASSLTPLPSRSNGR